MNSRERIINTIKGEGTDRIPVAPFIHINYVQEFFGKPLEDFIFSTIEVYDHFGFDIIHRNCTPIYLDTDQQSPDWQVEKTVKYYGKDRITTTVIHTPDGDLKEVHKLAWMTEYDAEASATEFFIKSKTDFDLFKKYQPPVAKIDTSPISRTLKALGEKGITAPWVQGAFNYPVIFYRKLDDILIDAMTDPSFYNEMMEYFLDRNKQIIAQFIDAGTHALSVGGNVASGKLISPAFFHEHISTYEKKLVDFIRSKGVYVLYHNCGYAANLFDEYRLLNFDIYESLTPPPYGDTVLQEALQKMNGHTVLSGNIDQIDFLKKATVQQVEQKVQQIFKTLGNRKNFILNTTDYLGEGTPRQNIHALFEAVNKFAVM